MGVELTLLLLPNSDNFIFIISQIHQRFDYVGGLTFIAFVASIPDKVAMNKEYLLDYQTKERDELDRFVRKIQSKGLDPDDRYPSLERLGIDHHPIVYSVCSTYRFDKEKIWSQIPLAGTLLIPLPAFHKERVLNACGFDVSDIPDLIRLAKDTGRVRFGLADSPEYYENMEHFDDIFKEFKPPELLYMPYGASSSTDLMTFRKFEEEFEALANVSYYASWAKFANNNSVQQNEISSLMQHRKDTYVYMKILDIEEEVNDISNLLVTDPLQADILLSAYEYLIEPIFDPLKASKNYSFSEIRNYHLNSLASTIPSSSAQQIPNLHSFPVEIGHFITKKTVLYPSSYSGCNDIIQHYEQNELYKVFEALDTAIKTQKGDQIPNHISELNEIMDNSWKEANKVPRLREGVQYGISVGIGCAGIFASSLTGVDMSSMMGLLGSFGFHAVDKALSKVEMSISDKLSRLVINPHLATIYDFKQKLNRK
jgi:hypothetical protein